MIHCNSWESSNASLISFVLHKQKNLGQRFCTSKMHLSPPVALAAVHSGVMVRLLLIPCGLLLRLWDSVIILCFVSILVLQSSRWGRESWLLCFVCLPGVLRLVVAFNDAMGLSAVCDCGISLSYSLTIFDVRTLCICTACYLKIFPFTCICCRYYYYSQDLQLTNSLH